MWRMAFGEIAKVVKGCECGKSGDADSDGFVGVLCAASIYQLYHLYRLFFRGGESAYFARNGCNKVRRLGNYNGWDLKQISIYTQFRSIFEQVSCAAKLEISIADAIAAAQPANISHSNHKTSPI
jgi:hypothetical protein